MNIAEHEGTTISIKNLGDTEQLRSGRHQSAFRISYMLRITRVEIMLHDEDADREMLQDFREEVLIYQESSSVSSREEDIQITFLFNVHGNKMFAEFGTSPTVSTMQVQQHFISFRCSIIMAMRLKRSDRSVSAKSVSYCTTGESADVLLTILVH